MGRGRMPGGVALWAREPGRGRGREWVQRLRRRVRLGRRLCRLLRALLVVGLGLRMWGVLGLAWEGMERRGVCLLLRLGLGLGQLRCLERRDGVRWVRVLAVVR